jgi:hypothetical protein
LTGLATRRAGCEVSGRTRLILDLGLVAADEDTVRDVIHAFNERGLAALDPHWAGGAPRRISDDDVAFIVATATTRPKKLGLPFTHFSIRKLAAYLQGCYGNHDPKQVAARLVRIRRERLRPILAAHDIIFQRTRTWKEAPVPRHLLGRPQPSRPATGHLQTHPQDPLLPRLLRLFKDKLWGIVRRRKGGDHTLAALKAIRAARTAHRST